MLNPQYTVGGMLLLIKLHSVWLRIHGLLLCQPGWQNGTWHAGMSLKMAWHKMTGHVIHAQPAQVHSRLTTAACSLPTFLRPCLTFVYPLCPAPSAPHRKTCSSPVDEDLRATLKAFCTGLVAALNKYYAFGSVFAEEV